jgi:L-rhamnose-H+ transport protein
MSRSLAGALLAILAGAINGSALLPLKYTRGWRFENTWLLYSLLAYLVAPLLIAFITVPSLPAVYADAGLGPCVLIAVFGLGWGLAVVLNGLGVSLVGLSLASAILMGSSVALGSIIPLLLKTPERMFTKEGLRILALDLLMLVGVLLCTWAGELRGRAISAEARTVTLRGIVICLLAGLLSTLFNIALSYGEVVSRAAVAHGAGTLNAANAVWGLAVSAGSIPGLAWCTWRLFRHKQWRLFQDGPRLRNTALCALMASLWISGTVGYGMAASMLGSLGPVIGWPIYMSAIILSSAFWGWVSGEWRGIAGRPPRVMGLGIVVQVIVLVMLSRLP